jgi:hypothetical protein
MKAIYLILLAVVLGAYVRALYRIKRESVGLSPLLGWMAGIGYFLLIPLTAITLNGGFRSPPEYEINGWGDIDFSNLASLKPFLVIWLSLLFACVAALFFCPQRSLNARGAPTISRRRLQRALVITAAIAIVGWAIMIYMVGGLEAFLASHWYNRIVDLTEEHGVGFLLFDHVTQANLIVFVGAAALHTNLDLKDGKIRWGVTAMMATFLLLGMIMSGNRIFIALFLLSVLVSSWLFDRKKVLIFMIIMAPAAGIFSGTWAAARHDLTNISDPSAEHLASYEDRNGLISATMDATEGTDVTLLTHIINDFGRRFPYLWGATYERAFTFFLPRSVDPSRSPDFTTLAASLYEPGGETSLASTALGEAYANFGCLGILIFPLWSWLICWLARRFVNGRSSLTSSVLFIALIWFVRGTLAESMVLTTGALALIHLLTLEPLVDDPSHAPRERRIAASLPDSDLNGHLTAPPARSKR